MIDPSKFERLNVIDTCSIWNVLASRILHGAARSSQVSFCITRFVEYECLYKRSQPWPERPELQKRLKNEMRSGAIVACSIDIEDLQDIAVLEGRKRLSKGELSSIVFAKKSLQAFMTDDRKAANLARTIIPDDKVQSTPHLFAWLYFIGRLQDSDKKEIINEFASLNRCLHRQFETAYTEALRCRLMANSAENSSITDTTPTNSPPR